jgi:hypothetical protein
MDENALTPNQSEFLLYTSQSGEVKIDVLLKDETVWLTQKGMQEFFDKAKQTVSEHIINVFKEWELEEEVVVRKFRITTQHEATVRKIRTVRKSFRRNPYHNKTCLAVFEKIPACGSKSSLYYEMTF